MSRRRASASPYFFILVLLIAAAYVIVQINHVPRREPVRRAGRTPAIREPRLFNLENEPNRGGERREWNKASCQSLGVRCDVTYFENWQTPAPVSCRTRIRNGYPVPDPICTPGGVDPTVTADVLRNPQWRTGCIRNCMESEAAKHVTYQWYGIHKPRENSGENQVCELDHLVPLEIGGADGLGNIWPECGPDTTTLDNRYFKVKDRVENYLANEVRSGRMPLETAQRGIASDWTQYLDEANRYCASGGRC